MKILLSLFIIFSFGCATSSSDVDKMVGADKSASYKDGFRDGCETGYAAVGAATSKFTKDAKRAQEDEQYSTGWTDGKKTCKDKYNAVQYPTGRS